MRKNTAIQPERNIEKRRQHLQPSRKRASITWHTSCAAPSNDGCVTHQLPTDGTLATKHIIRLATKVVLHCVVLHVNQIASGLCILCAATVAIRVPTSVSNHDLKRLTFGRQSHCLAAIFAVVSMTTEECNDIVVLYPIKRLVFNISEI